MPLSEQIMKRGGLERVDGGKDDRVGRKEGAEVAVGMQNK